MSLELTGRLAMHNSPHQQPTLVICRRGLFAVLGIVVAALAYRTDGRSANQARPTADTMKASADSEVLTASLSI